MKKPGKKSKKKYGISDFENKCRRSLNILLLSQDLMRRAQWHRAVNAVKMATSWSRGQESTTLGFITMMFESEQALQNVRYVSEGVADSVARQLRRLRCAVRIKPKVRRFGKRKSVYTLDLKISGLHRVRRPEVVLLHLKLSQQVRSRGGMYNTSAPRLRRAE